MTKTPTYAELKLRLKELEAEVAKHEKTGATLRESEERYRIVVEFASDLTYWRAADGRFIYVSPSCKKVTGYSTYKFMNNPKLLETIIHPADRSRWDKTCQSTFADLSPNPIEYRIKTKKGEIRYIDHVCRPIYDNDDNFLGVRGAIRDITKRKQAEETLHEETLRNEIILQTVMDGFLLMDIKGKILYANEAASVISGYLQKEIVGMNIRDFDSSKTHQKIIKRTEKLVKEGSDRFETKYRRKDGRTVDLEISTNYVKIGKESFFFSFFHNITRRKQVEQSLIKREKELEAKTSSLEEVNTALKVLLKRRDKDKSELEEKMLLNVRELVMNYIEKLKKSGLEDRQATWVKIMESNLNDIVSPFLHGLSSKYLKLTPMEIQVADLVKQGKTTKEIAELLNLSKGTIDTHRDNIRKKIGIKNKKINLRTQLLSFE